MKGLEKLKSGVVLIYPFLWSREHENGEEAGQKIRPVTVALVYGDKTEMNIDIRSQSHYLDSNNIIGAFSTAFMRQIKTAIRQSISQVKQVPRT